MGDKMVDCIFMEGPLAADFAFEHVYVSCSEICAECQACKPVRE